MSENRRVAKDIYIYHLKPLQKKIETNKIPRTLSMFDIL
jgi:hypothetical protein